MSTLESASTTGWRQKQPKQFCQIQIASSSISTELIFNATNTSIVQTTGWRWLILALLDGFEKQMVIFYLYGLPESNFRMNWRNRKQLADRPTMQTSRHHQHSMSHNHQQKVQVQNDHSDFRHWLQDMQWKIVQTWAIVRKGRVNVVVTMTSVAIVMIVTMMMCLYNYHSVWDVLDCQL